MEAIKNVLLAVVLMGIVAGSAKSAHATDCSLQIIVGSRHYVHAAGDIEEWNEDNGGISLECGSIAAGTFKNSYNQKSTFVALTKRDWFKSRHVKLGIMAGIVNGYDDVSESGLLPLIAGTATVGLVEGINAVGIVLPGSVALAFEMEIR